MKSACSIIQNHLLENKNVFLCNFSEATAAMDALMKIETNALHTKKLAFLRRDMLVRLLCIRYTFFDEIFHIQL